jgi:hypothetical protein
MTTTVRDGCITQRLGLRRVVWSDQVNGRYCWWNLGTEDQASSLLCEVAASCFSRSLAHDLVVESDFIRLFRILKIEDSRVCEPMKISVKLFWFISFHVDKWYIHVLRFHHPLFLATLSRKSSNYIRKNGNVLLYTMNHKWFRMDHHFVFMVHNFTK